MRGVVLLALVGCNQLFELTEVTLPPDARIDAPPECPVTYVSIDGQSSKYRYVEQRQRWDDAAADCNNDLEGATHLIVFEELAEMIAVRPLVTDPLPWNAFAGYARDATGDPDVFFAVTGERIESGLPGFEVWGGGEPNNFGDGEPITFFEDDYELRDGEADRTELYICECDGRAPTQTYVIR